ncbi:MAG TPA: PH domain-containing protein [Asanoa sp.]
MKRVVRSWGRNSLTALTVVLLGFAALVCVVGALGDHPARWLAILGGLVVAVDVLASLALAVRALVMDVSSRPRGLRVRGLRGTRTYPWASIVGVGTDEGLIASTGPYHLPVVEVSEESGRRRRVRLWMLARSLNRSLAPTIEQLEGMIASAHGARPGGLTARDVVTPEE